MDVVRGFEEKWGFPQCFGAVDGSHIPIIPQDVRWQVRLFIWFSTGAALSHSVSDGLVPFLESFYFLSTLHERALKAVPCQLVGNRLIYSIVPNCPLQLTLDPILTPYLYIHIIGMWLEDLRRSGVSLNVLGQWTAHTSQ